MNVDFVLREKSSFGLKLKLSPLMGKLGKLRLGVVGAGVSVLISSVVDGLDVVVVVTSFSEPMKILLDWVLLGLKNNCS